MMREPNPAKKPNIDAIVANPPFSYRPTDALADDVRFKSHGLAPKSAADFAFLLHGFHFLKDEGVMAIILPHGYLAARPPESPRFRRNRPTLERRAGDWLRDFNSAAQQPGFSIATHLA